MTPSRARRRVTRPGPSRTVRRVTVIGGGNGISAVLRGLSPRTRLPGGLDVTAVVATADDGGSSGRLRRDRGGIPPGDLRSCLLALTHSRGNPFVRLFGHRYDGEGDLAGHSLGNLILSALAEDAGSWIRALDRAAELLGVRARVLPVSLGPLRLEAETQDGIRISGESRIGESHCAVRRVWLDPDDAKPAPGVLRAIRSADLVVIGPGSLFTSLLAVLLVPGVADSVRRSRGRRVLVANLMTQPGETLGMDLVGHLEALDRHVGPGLVQSVLVHGSPLDPDRVRPYRDQGAEPIPQRVLETGRRERIIARDLVTRFGKIRHDPARLARCLLAPR